MRQFVRPKVVISKCIEFDHCRYDGSMISSDFVKALKAHVDFLPVCAEMEIGLGVPRDTIRIVSVDGEIRLDGKTPISTLGGLKARGHPVGATGVYQLAELYLQLSGQAGPNQVPNARIGMAQNIGGTGATVITHILERED